MKSVLKMLAVMLGGLLGLAISVGIKALLIWLLYDKILAYYFKLPILPYFIILTIAVIIEVLFDRDTSNASD